jgi:hypothetical protein
MYVKKSHLCSTLLAGFEHQSYPLAAYIFQVHFEHKFLEGNY